MKEAAEDPTRGIFVAAGARKLLDAILTAEVKESEKWGRLPRKSRIRSKAELLSGLSRSTGMMQAKEIMGMLRQRHPFPSSIERIIEIDPGRSCTALKNVTLTEPCFQVISPIIRSSPACILSRPWLRRGGSYSTPPGPEMHLVLAAVDKAKFVREVLPGDTMVLSCTLDKTFGAFAKVSIIVTVADTIVAKGEITYGFRHARE